MKIGAFTFGGAYAAVPLIRDVVLEYGWISEDMLSYIIAVAESTPGPIMVNLATYVGSTQAGALGAFIATSAVVLPSFGITILIMVMLKKWMERPAVQAVLGGLKPCIIGIILAVGIEMLVRNLGFGIKEGFAPDPVAIAIAAGLALIYYGSRKVMKKKLSPIALIAISAAVGILVYGV